ncbi:5'-3' exonuclease H3TH domain-containing protein [Actinoplanes sp. NPDC051859]|uniref:5'-3' exonuclease n=1 Tax=Actinoplanes sp. NPDC051859 TaxID=3363909 RepID=UPI003790E3BD
MGGPRTSAAVPLLLVDGFNLLWSATFGFPAQIQSRDKTRDLTGLFAFFALLRVAVRKELPAPPEIIVVFDGEHGSADRRNVDADYKAQRPTDDDALAPLRHLPDVKRGLDTLGITWVELPHAEADDVIATLTTTTPADRQVIILSRDRDFYQLITDRVRVLNTGFRAGARLVDPDGVRERHDVDPNQWCDFRALTGDPADNIPGVRGIGPGTAKTLLAGGLTLDDLPSSGRLDQGRGRAVAAQWDQALKWRDMIRLVHDLDVPTAPTGQVSPPLPAAREIVEALGLW